jgi:hypothetical protein
MPFTGSFAPKRQTALRNWFALLLFIMLTEYVCEAKKGKGKEGKIGKGSGKAKDASSADAQQLAKSGFKAMEIGDLNSCVQKFGLAVKQDPSYSDYHTQVRSQDMQPRSHAFAVFICCLYFGGEQSLKLTSS